MRQAAAFWLVVISVQCISGCVRLAGPGSPPQHLAFVYALDSNESVFAYSRISPNGRYLAYASEVRSTKGPERIVNVVDLSTKRIVFEERGFDAYFATDSKRMMYMSKESSVNGVAILELETGLVSRGVAPTSLGDYFSWGSRDGRDMIMTVQGNYYYLDAGKGIMPSARVVSCPWVGTGERPLLSKDGRWVSTFVRGSIVVRRVDDCEGIIETGVQGAKADFSFDGRYLATHVTRTNGEVYDIAVIDLWKRTIRTITSALPGSSFFPSWTRDGRLSFRYESSGHHGFVVASNFLKAPSKPLPPLRSTFSSVKWSDVFPETPLPNHRLNIVLVWAPWSAHSPDAIHEFERARRAFVSSHADVGTLTAIDPASNRSHAERMLVAATSSLPRIQIEPERIGLTQMTNQSPTVLVFQGDELVDLKLGTQTFAQLREIVEAWTPIDNRTLRRR